MSIHGLFMRIFSAFRGGNALHINAKHFVFDLSCDVTGDLEVNLFLVCLIYLVQGYPVPFEFFRHFYWLPR